MPNHTKGARLYWRDSQKRKGRRTAVTPGTWVIRDGQVSRSTGCARDEIEQAEAKLREYLAQKHDPRRASDPASKSIADALAVYTDDVIEDLQPDIRRREAVRRIERLKEFFSNKAILEINHKECKAYVKQRKAVQAARRELEDLRAALKHCAAQGLTGIIPAIWLPEKSERRQRFLSEKEAAKLLRVAWRMRQTFDSDETDRRIGKHLAHFIVLGLYSGTRRTAMATAALEPVVGCPYFDLEQGLFYRTPRNAKRNKKNQNQSVQRVPLPLLAHLRRWKKLGYRFAVEWRGAGVKKINKAFRHACELAGLGTDVIPHTLRHTKVTWMLQHGFTTWDVAEFVGMSEATVREHYGHFSVEHQAAAANHRAEARKQRLAVRR
jgi:integrase